MTPEAALYEFWSGFGIPAYAESSTPEDVEYPYLTYELVTGEWGAGEVNSNVNVWYYTSTESAPNAKVREIGAAIGAGGRQLQCDGGTLWIKKGSPWAQAVTNQDNTSIKRRYLNVDIEYQTI